MTSIREKLSVCQLLNNCINSVVQPFSSDDVDYLVAHLTIPELRREVRHADIEYSVSKALDEIPNSYWRDFGNACSLALKFRLLQATVPQMGDGSHHSFDIQEVKQRTDIVDTIGQHVTLRKSGRNLAGLCPLHDDHSPSLTVYPDDQRWWCFSCNTGGDVIDFVKAINSLNTHEALEQLR